MNTDLMKKIDFYLDEKQDLYEGFSASGIPDELMRKLKKYLLVTFDIKFEKAQFDEVQNASPGRIKDKIIVCYFKEIDNSRTPGFIVIESDDNGKILSFKPIIGYRSFSSGRDNGRYTNKKSAIENADRIYVLTKSNYEMAVSQTNARVYAKTKDSREKKIMDSFKAMRNTISKYLDKLASGEIPEIDEIKKCEPIFQKLIRMNSSLHVFRDDQIPGDAIDVIEKSLR